MNASQKIAVVGGGSAGIIASYLLDKAGHEVSLFEKQPVLGGNIRTSNKNLHIEGLDRHLKLEGGVVEFPDAFFHFKNLLSELKVKTVPVPVGTAIFPKKEHPILSAEVIRRNRKGWNRIRDHLRYQGFLMSAIPVLIKSQRMNPRDLADQSLKDLLPGNGILSQWIKNLTMYSYSIPFSDLDAFPAAMAIQMIKDYRNSSWFRIDDGVYTYVDKILERYRGHLNLNCNIRKIIRNEEKVIITHSDQASTFDKVVLATPPDQVLKLLADPDDTEKRRFGAWQKNTAQTVIHTDRRFYQKHRIQNPSEFDFFQTNEGWGYNASLNGLCGLPKDPPYNLSYNLESLIEPKSILKVVKHETPKYEISAFKLREEIIQHNGENNTFFAGAYLGDGLHEGATVSAMRVAEKIGE